jgi:hypothetical protein
MVYEPKSESLKREPYDGAARPTRLDDEERQALEAEGLDPDDPAVIAAIDLVRWELSLGI